MSDPFLPDPNLGLQRELRQLIKENRDLREENARLKLEVSHPTRAAAKPPHRKATSVASEKSSASLKNATAGSPPASEPGEAEETSGKKASSVGVLTEALRTEEERRQNAESRLQTLKSYFEAFVNATVEREAAYEIVHTGIYAELEQSRGLVKQLRRELQEVEQTHSAQTARREVDLNERAGKAKEEEEGLVRAGSPPSSGRTRTTTTPLPSDALGTVLEELKLKLAQLEEVVGRGGGGGGGGHQQPFPRVQPSDVTSRSSQSTRRGPGRPKGSVSNFKRARPPDAGAMPIPTPPPGFPLPAGEGGGTSPERNGRDRARETAHLPGPDGEREGQKINLPPPAPRIPRRRQRRDTASLRTTSDTPSGAPPPAPASLFANFPTPTAARTAAAVEVRFGEQPILDFLTLWGRTPEAGPRGVLTRQLWEFCTHTAAVVATHVRRYWTRQYGGERETTPVLSAMWSELEILYGLHPELPGAVAVAFGEHVVRELGPEAAPGLSLTERCAELRAMGLGLRFWYLLASRATRRAASGAGVGPTRAPTSILIHPNSPSNIVNNNSTNSKAGALQSNLLPPPALLFYEASLSLLRLWRSGRDLLAATDFDPTEVKGGGGGSRNEEGNGAALGPEREAGFAAYCSFLQAAWGPEGEVEEVLTYQGIVVRAEAEVITAAGLAGIDPGSSSSSSLSSSWQLPRSLATYAIQGVVPLCLGATAAAGHAPPLLPAHPSELSTKMQPSNRLAPAPCVARSVTGTDKATHGSSETEANNVVLGTENPLNQYKEINTDADNNEGEQPSALQRWRGLCEALGWAFSLVPLEPIGNAAIRVLAQAGKTFSASEIEKDKTNGGVEKEAQEVLGAAVALRCLLLYKGVGYLQDLREALTGVGEVGAVTESLFAQLLACAVVDLKLQDTRDAQWAHAIAFLHDYLQACEPNTASSAEAFVASARSEHVLAVRAIWASCQETSDLASSKYLVGALRWVAAQAAALSYVTRKGTAPVWHPLRDTTLGRVLMELIVRVQQAL